MSTSRWVANFVTLLLIVAFGQIGCALLLNGRRQDLKLAVKPQGSTLSVFKWDGTRVASSDEASTGELTLPRPHRGLSYLVVASRDGFCPTYWLTGSKPTTGAYIDLALMLPAIIPGALAFNIDAASNAAFDIAPSAFEAKLSETSSCDR